MRRGALAASLAIVAVLAAVTPPSPGAARAPACGKTKHYAPEGATAPPLAIGDSVMLGAVEPLVRRGFEVDARVCRQMSEGLAVLDARARAGTLPSAVAIGLGTNWTVTPEQIRQALMIVGRERVLALVTPREVGGAASADQHVIRAAGRRWPGRVRVVDWVVRSAGHGDWFWSDGLHLTARGGRAFARLVARALAQRTRTAGPATEPALTR
jgi:hypothetical protein